jgi:hypothetical protein
MKSPYARGMDGSSLMVSTLTIPDVNLVHVVSEQVNYRYSVVIPYVIVTL